MLSKKLRQAFVTRLAENGQVTAVYYLQPLLARMHDNIAEPRVHFRRAPGQVEYLNRMGIDHVIQVAQHGIAHRFRARRPGINMAMQTALVTGISKVHLQCLQPAASDGRK